MAKKRSRSCVFSVPYSSRGIYKNGKPFIEIVRARSAEADGSVSPTEVDAVSRRIAKLLCGRR